MAKKRVIGRKLLVASVGVAAISYVACTTTQTSGNLMAPEVDASAEEDAQPDALVTSGNLMPPPEADARADAPVTSGNLMPPPPVDAGDGGDASADAETD